MKKLSLILAALALVLGISQCKKQEEPAASGEKQHIVLNASFGDSNSKIAEDGIGGLIWSLGDNIKVYNSSDQEIGTLGCRDAANGTFEGEISESSGIITFKFGSTINYLQQTGELNEAISLTAEAPYDKDGNYSVTMKMMDRAVVKLDLSKILTEVGQRVDFSAQNGMGVSLIIAREDFESPFYVAIPAPTKIVKVGNIAVDWNLEPNFFYTAAGEGGTPTGQAIVIEPYEMLIFDSFEDYNVDGNIAAEALEVGNDWWTTWSDKPGDYEDGIVDEFQGAKCGHLTYDNDQVLLLGDKESGIYDLEFDILVPQGKNGYFNILHNFNGPSSTWAMQCYLHLTNDGQTSTDAPGHGTIHAGSNSTADIPCVYDAWMHFRLHVDTDNDVAGYYYTAPDESEVLVCTWQWSKDSFGESTVGKKLSAMDFFPPENASTSEYYLDNISFKKIL